MKYGNYIFEAKEINNLGDQMQILAIDNIYKEMIRTGELTEEDIICLNYHDLKKYSGEYVVLPVVMPMVDYYPDGFADRFSDRIIPVFLGLTMVKETLSDKEVAYFKRFEPIGCRDERTLLTMRRYGIISYLHGCITATFPRRKVGKYDSVYIVDIEPELYDIIPVELKRNAIHRTHLIANKLEDPLKTALEQYQEYLDNAGLVITSLLHCAVPCMAGGIPVILLNMNSKVSYRKGWLEKLLPIYTWDKRFEINWNPEMVNYEEHKDKLKKLTIKRIRETYDKYADIYDISYYYEEREKNAYMNDQCESIKQFVDNNWKDFDLVYEYSVWGLSQITEWIVDYISDRYKNAKLCHVYDTYRQEVFRGLMSEPPDNIKDNKSETIFVTAYGAMKAALKLFDEAGIPEEKYALVTLVN